MENTKGFSSSLCMLNYSLNLEVGPGEKRFQSETGLPDEILLNLLFVFSFYHEIKNLNPDLGF